jgi:hypothetical protein
MHVYEVHPRKDHRGVDLISDALPFDCLWYAEPDAASGAIRLVFLIETQPTDHGAANRNPELGGIGDASAFVLFSTGAFPNFHSPDAISVIAWPRFGYAKFLNRSHDAVIRVYDDAGNVIETHEHPGDFKEW